MQGAGRLRKWNISGVKMYSITWANKLFWGFLRNLQNFCLQQIAKTSTKIKQNKQKFQEQKQKRKIEKWGKKRRRRRRREGGNKTSQFCVVFYVVSDGENIIYDYNNVTCNCLNTDKSEQA